MPKYYCDYCDVFLTHDSTSVRKAHNSGRNHLQNVRDYYAGLGNDTAQSFIDNITKAFERAGGNRPMGPGGFGGPRPFGPPGGFGPPGSRPMRQFGTGPPPPGFGAPPPGFVQQRGPPPTFGGGPGFGGPPPMNGAFNQPPPGAFQPQQPFAVRQGMPMPPPGFAGPPPGMAPGFGGGMSPPHGQFGAPPQASSSAGPQPAQQQMAPGSPPPAQSPPGQGVGMQMNPARAAALGLR